jgi:hypothetical protein
VRSSSQTNNAIARAIVLSQDRQTIEDRYLLARAEFIQASQQKDRFGVLNDRLVAYVPDSIDLAHYPGLQQEPLLPRLVTAMELGWATE